MIPLNSGVWKMHNTEFTKQVFPKFFKLKPIPAIFQQLMHALKHCRMFQHSIDTYKTHYFYLNCHQIPAVAVNLSLINE